MCDEYKCIFTLVYLLRVHKHTHTHTQTQTQTHTEHINTLGLRPRVEPGQSQTENWHQCYTHTHTHTHTWADGFGNRTLRPELHTHAHTHTHTHLSRWIRRVEVRQELLKVREQFFCFFSALLLYNLMLLLPVSLISCICMHKYNKPHGSPQRAEKEIGTCGWGTIRKKYACMIICKEYMHCVLVCVLVCSRLPVCPPAFSNGRTRCRRARALVELLLAAVTFTAAVALLFGIAQNQSINEDVCNKLTYGVKEGGRRETHATSKCTRRITPPQSLPCLPPSFEMECSVVKSITDNNNCATTRHVYCQAARRRPAVPTFNFQNSAAAGEIQFFFPFYNTGPYQHFTTPGIFFLLRLGQGRNKMGRAPTSMAKRKCIDPWRHHFVAKRRTKGGKDYQMYVWEEVMWLHPVGKVNEAARDRTIKFCPS